MQMLKIEQDAETREQIEQICTTLNEIKEDLKFLKSQITSGANALAAEHYYSVREICGLLGISSSTLYDWIKTRGFPQGQLIGTMRRFDFTQVRAWIEQTGKEEVSY